MGEGAGDADRAPDGSYCTGRTHRLISGTVTSEGNICPQRSVSCMEARQREGKEQVGGSVFQTVRETERQKADRQTNRQTGIVSGILEFSSHIVDWVSSLHFFIVQNTGSQR